MDSPARPQPACALRARRQKALYGYCLSDVSAPARIGPLCRGTARPAFHHVRIRARHGQRLRRFLVVLEPDLLETISAGWLDLGLGRPGTAPAPASLAAGAFSKSQTQRQNFLGLRR